MADEDPTPSELRPTVGSLVASMEALAVLAVLLGERANGTAPEWPSGSTLPMPRSSTSASAWPP